MAHKKTKSKKADPATVASFDHANDIPINTWSEFPSAVAEIKSRAQKRLKQILKVEIEPKIVYRGHADSDWLLESTLERHNEDEWNLYTYTQLALRCLPQIETLTGQSWGTSDPDSVIEELKQSDLLTLRIPTYGLWVYLRQHGFPSPLLDWTESPYVAAFFALVDGVQPSAATSSVVAYVTGGPSAAYLGVPNISFFSPYVSTVKRHFAQQALYSLCTRSEKGADPLDAHQFVSHEEVLNQDREETLMFRILIPNTERLTARVQLNEVNINHFSLYGSEDALMNTLAFKEINMRDNQVLINHKRLKEKMARLVGKKIIV